jgi:hypothetical protein
MVASSTPLPIRSATVFKKRTLFVVGAGASKEFNLPLGPELASIIATKMDIKPRDYGEDQEGAGDFDIYNQFRRRAPNKVNEHLAACRVIKDGVQMSSSIDDFLDVHSSNKVIQRVGKLSIVKTILEQERESKLWFNKSNIYNRMKVSRFENTWLIKLVRMLGRGVLKEKIETIFDNVAFIVFNYDRCIEQCLYHALQQLYSVQESKAEEIMSRLDIIHPYGTVGEFKTSRGGVAFGGESDHLSEDYSALSDGIKTYTEQIHDEDELMAIREQAELAQRIVFLGFAFHDQNIALLKSKIPLKRKDIYATAYGMSKSDVDVVHAQLLNFFEGKEREIMENGHIVLRADLTCAALFDQYTKSLPA